AEELTNGDLRRGGLVGDDEVLDVAANGCVEVDESLIDKLHDERGCPDLGDGTDLEDRVGRGLNTVRFVQDARRSPDHVAITENRHRCGGYLVFGDKVGQLF